MDRKSVIILVASLGVLVLLQAVIIPRFFPPIPVNTNTTAAVTNVAGTNVAAATAPTTNVATPAVAPSPAATVPASAIRVATEGPEQVEVLTNATGEALYTFTSRGGGVKHVQLARYLELVGCERPRGSNTVYASLNEHARVPILAMQADELFGDNIFTLTRTSPTAITAEKVLASGLRVVKEFSLGSNYQVHANVRIENPTAQAIALPAQSISIGTGTPMGPRDDGLMMGVFWFNGQDTEHVEHSHFEPAGGCMGIGRRGPR